jgi:hypothetical protein
MTRFSWTPERVAKLEAAYSVGGLRAAQAAFPSLTEGALRVAAYRNGIKVIDPSASIAAGHAARKRDYPVRARAALPLAKRDPEIARRYAALDLGGLIGQSSPKRARPAPRLSGDQFRN